MEGHARRCRESSTGVRALLVLVGAVALLLLAPAAHAHTDLVATSPAQGARTAAPPASVMLVFDGPLAGTPQVAVRGPDGTAVRGSTLVSGTTVEVPLDARSPGRYEVYYRVTGDDGHPVSGRLSFRATGSAVPRPGHPATTVAPAAAAVGPDARVPGGPWWWLGLLLPVVVVQVVRSRTALRRPVPVRAPRRS